MKKLITKYLLTIAILPAFLTGCYTQVATQDDPNLNYSSDEAYQDYAYENEKNTGGGYFDESDTLENYYFDESDSGEVVINNYYGYNPLYPDDDYDYYPSVNISFGFGFGYGYSYYYPWYTGWYYPYYPGYCYYPIYYYPIYYYGYYPYYGHGGYYGG